MERKPVESKTGICGIGYDPATQTLEIAFKDKHSEDGIRLYHYMPVTQPDYNAFLAAESIGSHFIQFIKPNFTCSRLEPEKAEGAANGN